MNLKMTEPKPVRRTARGTLAVVVSAALTAATMPTVPAMAQEGAGPAKQGVPIIRDAEIEQLLRDYTRPILRVAGLAHQHIRVVIINSRVFNAFVADGRRIFVNAGALMQTKTPNELIGVFAHETGHIAGGHISRRQQMLARAQTESIIAMLLGVGAMVAGAHAGTNSGANIGAAALSMPQAIIQSSMLAYIRTQEEQADRAGVKFLTETHQSAKGMYDVFKRMYDQSMFADHDVNPYFETHPMPQQRMDALAKLAKSSPYWNKKDPPELQLRHDLMRAKLFGYLDRPSEVYRRYPPRDHSLPARYARAVSASRYLGLQAALTKIDGLIRSRPNDPYFYELKGQTLLDDGHPAQAVAPLRRAVRLAPHPALIQALLGRALIATNNPRDIKEAVPLLRHAVNRDAHIPGAYMQLAMAYGHIGAYAEADLASAQAAVQRGDIPTAHLLANRAKGRFPVGSPGWIKADDILGMKLPHRSPP